MRRHWYSVFAPALTIGCASHELPTNQSSNSEHAASLITATGRGINRPIPPFPDLPDRLPDRTLSQGVEAFSRVMSDAELVEAARKVDGVVVIGLKPSGALRTTTSKVFPSITKEEIVAARQLLTNNGVQLLKGFRHIAAVVGRIDPETAPTIRNLSVVNYLRPRVYGQAAGTVGPFTLGRKTSLPIPI
jgi:hypothetical protein